jgi:hypothetical protein
MRNILALKSRSWRRAVAAVGISFAVCGGTVLAVAAPAANAAAGMSQLPRVSQLPTVSQGTVVYKTCQNRSAGVKTCEWLYEWPYKLINGRYTINVVAYGSMNGTVNKSILQVQTWARRTSSSPPHEIAVLRGPSGTGYIQGSDGKRLCAGDTAGGLQSRFTYKYWDPKPVSAWITGTAYGLWQYDPTPCNSL